MTLLSWQSHNSWPTVPQDNIGLSPSAPKLTRYCSFLPISLILAFCPHRSDQLTGPQFWYQNGYAYFRLLHSPPSSAEFKSKSGSIPLLPLYALMACTGQTLPSNFPPPIYNSSCSTWHKIQSVTYISLTIFHIFKSFTASITQTHKHVLLIASC